MSEEKFIYMVEKLERLKDGYDLNHTNGDYAYGILREWLEEDMYENLKKDKRSSVTHEELREALSKIEEYIPTDLRFCFKKISLLKGILGGKK